MTPANAFVCDPLSQSSAHISAGCSPRMTINVCSRSLTVGRIASDFNSLGSLLMCKTAQNRSQSAAGRACRRSPVWS
jgi:hypothetical protein